MCRRRRRLIKRRPLSATLQARRLSSLSAQLSVSDKKNCRRRRFRHCKANGWSKRADKEEEERAEEERGENLRKKKGKKVLHDDDEVAVAPDSPTAVAPG